MQEVAELFPQHMCQRTRELFSKEPRAGWVSPCWHMAEGLGENLKHLGSLGNSLGSEIITTQADGAIGPDRLIHFPKQLDLHAPKNVKN